MGRRRDIKERCEECWFRHELCVCALIPQRELNTRLLLLMHHTEWASTTNTGRFALRALPNSEVRFRGLPEVKVSLDDLRNGPGQLLLLYPSEKAQLLTPEWVATLKKPVTLIVPDGTWRQAAKVFRRERVLREQAIPVMLPEVMMSDYLLRRMDKPGALCTLEAIAHAMGVLEGEEIRDDLLELFNLVNLRTLATRSPDWIDAMKEWAKRAGRQPGKTWSSVHELREKYLPKGYRP